MAELAGQTVLITRPEIYSGYLKENVERLGGRPIVYPTLETEFCLEGLDRSSFTEHDMAIFTSRSAVAAVAEYFEQVDFEWPNSLKCATVGNKTAASIRSAFGVENVIVPSHEYGGSALMAHRSMENIAGDKVIFFDGGGDRSVFLIRALEEKNCEIVTHAVVYRRMRPEINAGDLNKEILSGSIDFVVFTSVASAVNLIDRLDKESIIALKKACMAVYSERIRMELSKLGFNLIEVAAMPSDDAVIETMIRKTKQKAPLEHDSQSAYSDIKAN